MNIKSKRFSVPESQQATGTRGEIIRQVVNYLARLNGGKYHRIYMAIVTVHAEGANGPCGPGTMVPLWLYAPEDDDMKPVCAEELYRQVEAWMPRRLEGKFVKVRLEGTHMQPRYFKT